MVDYYLLLFAFNKREWNTVAKLMISLYAEYVEGYIDKSKDKFNNVFKYLPTPALKCMREQNRNMFSTLEELIDFRIPKSHPATNKTFS